MLRMKCTKVDTLGEELVPRNSMMGIRCWMRSHFQYWNDYNEVSFSKEIIEWDRAVSMYFLVSAWGIENGTEVWGGKGVTVPHSVNHM